MISENRYLVCATKDGDLFITTRKERETSLNVLIDSGSYIGSFVVKPFDSLEEAKKFIADQNAADSMLNKIL